VSKIVRHNLCGRFISSRRESSLERDVHGDDLSFTVVRNFNVTAGERELDMVATKQ
jgi:hypothetical protein